MKISNFDMFKFDDDLEEDKLELLSESQKWMRKLGLIVDKVNINSCIRLLPVLFVFNMVAYGQIGHIIHFLLNNSYSFFDVADDISVILTVITLDFINIILVLTSPYLTKVCKDLGEFSNPDMEKAPGIVALDRLFARFLKYCFGVFFISGLLTWIIYFMQDCEPGEVSACGFIYLPYLPFIDIYNLPWRQIVLTCQIISPYSLGPVSIVNISQYVFVNEVLILRYDHLGTLIERIPLVKPEVRKLLIGRIVRYHSYLVRVNRDLNKATSKAYTVHLFVTPINMSVIAYQLVGKEIIFSSLVHFLSYVFMVTVTCVCGERLTSHTCKLPDRIFYAMPLDDVDTMKMMKLILLQAQHPLSVVAGGVTSVNHVLMVNIYQTIWSTLTLLIGTE